MIKRLRIRRIPRPSGGYYPGWITHQIGDDAMNTAVWFETFREAFDATQLQLAEATA